MNSLPKDIKAGQPYILKFRKCPQSRLLIHHLKYVDALNIQKHLSKLNEILIWKYLNHIFFTNDNSESVIRYYFQISCMHYMATLDELIRFGQILYHQNGHLQPFCILSTNLIKCRYSMINGTIALKFDTGVSYR